MSVLYLFRKTDLRIHDNRSLELAFSFNLPVSCVACLDIRGEWNRRGETTGLCAVGFMRRRFYLESFKDLEKGLREKFMSDKTSSSLSLSESSLSETLAAILEQNRKLCSENKAAPIKHVICTQELGSYESSEERKVRKLIVDSNKNSSANSGAGNTNSSKNSINFHLVEDDCLINISDLPFEDNILPHQIQYTQFRKAVEKEANTYQNKSAKHSPNGNFIPVRDFVNHYCKKLSNSGEQIAVGSTNVGALAAGCAKGKRMIVPLEYKNENKNGNEIDGNKDSNSMNLDNKSDSDVAMNDVDESPTIMKDGKSNKYQTSNSNFKSSKDGGPEPVKIHSSMKELLTSNPDLLKDSILFTDNYKVADRSSDAKDISEKTINDLLNNNSNDSSNIAPHKSGSSTASHFQGGENAAFARLKDYFWTTDSVSSYKETRNGSLGSYFSTKFSMYLAVGNISARQICHELARYEEERYINDSTYWVLFELLWRDYLHHAIRRDGVKFFLQGGVQERPWGGKFGNQKRTLRNSAKEFKAWATGQTGLPIVDAWMRELRQTGFMSNRGRQNVASVLVFNLKIDWRWGAELFEHFLLDHDVASNYGNWQTIAGVGFQDRENIFNVIKQSKQYESNGDYVLEWVPELKKCVIDSKTSTSSTNNFNSNSSAKQLLVHTPWEIRTSYDDNFEIPSIYRNPVIDPKSAFRYDNSNSGGSGNSGPKGQGKKGKNHNESNNSNNNYHGRKWQPNGFHDSNYHEGGGGENNDDPPTKKRGKWKNKA